MNQLVVDGYLIDKPLDKIIEDLQIYFPSHKLRDVKVTSDEIIVTCVNSDHANGQENHPDAHINLTSKRAKYGWYHCFACDLSCSFVGFIAHYFDKSEEYAKKWLIDHYGVRQKETISLGDPIVPKQQIIKTYLDEKELDKYQNYCYYLQKRKITRNVCEYFNVKFDPVKREVLFPCYNEAGKLVMIPTRKIDYKQFYLPKDIEKPVYGLDKIIKKNINECILTEGPFDALTGWSYGFPTIASLGNISDGQIESINKSPITHLLLMFDNDGPGRAFAERVKNKLTKRILVDIINIPVGFKDINDLDYETFWNLISKYVKK